MGSMMSKDMNMQSDRAAAYARQRLESELPSELRYHGAHHTIDDVVPAARRLADAHELSPEDRMILLTAAWYHDLGFIERYDQNEVFAVKIAQASLGEFGYTPEQIERVGRVILATELSRTPTTLLEEIMVDADLDSLGRTDMVTVGLSLRREEEIFRAKYLSDEAWFREEIGFLRTHRYHTLPQRRYRNPGKVRNFLYFCRMLMLEQQPVPSQTASHSQSDEAP